MLVRGEMARLNPVRVHEGEGGGERGDASQDGRGES